MNKNTILSNVLWKFAERLLAQVVSLIISIVLARLLLPDDYGLVAMVTVFTTIANIFVTSGIPNALIQKKDVDNKDFSSVFFFNVVLSFVLYALIFFGAPLLAGIYSQPQLIPIIRVMGIQVIVAAVNSVQSAYVSKNMLFRKYFWSTLTSVLLSGALGIVMAYTGFGVWALVAQQLTSIVVTTVVIFFTIDWRPIAYFSWKRIASLVKFGWKILFEGLANTVAGQLNNLVIGGVYTSGDLAFYTKAQQFPSLITNNISDAISSVLFPAISNEQDDTQRVVHLLRRSVRTTSFIIFPMLTGLALVAEPFISILLTDKWLDCVPYLQISCLASAMTVGMIPRHQALNGIGRSDIFMYEHMAARILSFILLFAVYKHSVMAIAISGIIGTFAMVLTVMYTSKRYNSYAYRDQIRDVVPSIGGCALMALCVYPIGLLNLSNFATLALQILTGVIVYVVYSFVFKSEEVSIILGFLSRFLKKKKQ